MKELKLPDSLATNLASGHPWVYRDHVGSFTAASGTWVKVTSGSYSAVGLWDEESAIALRIFSSVGPVNAEWIRERVQEAWDNRVELREAGVTGYRLIFGEGDGLPGIVVDLYGQYAIVVTYSKSLGGLLQPLAQAVSQVSGVLGVVRRTKVDDQVQLRLLTGEMPPDRVVVEEYGMKLIADLTHGQKTGLFFDHRENRQLVGKCARDKTVLNLFSYTGGFSLAAALGGATHVTSVDLAGPAVDANVENFKQNGLGSFSHDAIRADVFDYLEKLKKEQRQFDLVVCDPPTFAKNRTQLKAAEKAYRKLMSLALDVVAPGGVFCAASCTSQVGPQAFRLALVDAARKSRVRLRIIADIGQPLDHPVAVAHEEGRYLKFIMSRVHARC
jgi:23S rRNA (cytosine1962-C5)-methyltransferase